MSFCYPLTIIYFHFCFATFVQTVLLFLPHFIICYCWIFWPAKYVNVLDCTFYYFFNFQMLKKHPYFRCFLLYFVLFPYFFTKKEEKRQFWPGNSVRSTRSRVEIYNMLLYFNYFSPVSVVLFTSMCRHNSSVFACLPLILYICMYVCKCDLICFCVCNYVIEYKTYFCIRPPVVTSSHHF